MGWGEKSPIVGENGLKCHDHTEMLATCKQIIWSVI